MSFNFEKLDVYSNALDFAHEVYGETVKWPKIHQYSIADQLRRASLSISLNIAEGSSRTRNDYKRFLSIARGSCFECIPIIEIAKKQKILSTKKANKWYNHCVVMAKMMSRLKNSI